MKSLLLALLACTSLALSQTTGKLGNAAITENNPNGVTYIASLPSGNGIQGQIVGVSNTNGTGVNFNVNFYQFPDASEGPFRTQSSHTLLPDLPPQHFRPVMQSPANSTVSKQCTTSMSTQCRQTATAPPPSLPSTPTSAAIPLLATPPSRKPAKLAT
jgi:hypothetical protein